MANAGIEALLPITIVMFLIISTSVFLILKINDLFIQSLCKNTVVLSALNLEVIAAG